MKYTYYRFTEDDRDYADRILVFPYHAKEGFTVWQNSSFSINYTRKELDYHIANKLVRKLTRAEALLINKDVP